MCFKCPSNLLHRYRYTKYHTDSLWRISPATAYYSGILLHPVIRSSYRRNTSNSM